VFNSDIMDTSLSSTESLSDITSSSTEKLAPHITWFALKDRSASSFLLPLIFSLRNILLQVSSQPFVELLNWRCIPSLRKMELSFVIWIIVLGSGYIAFPVANVFLAFIRGFNFYKENYIHDIPFFKLLSKNVI
jgi:hypothetical protein